MPTIYADAEDGYVSIFNNTTSWSSARDATSGTASGDSDASRVAAVRAGKIPGRGGVTNWSVTRSFMFFDTSAISTPLDSCELGIYGVTNGTGVMNVCKATSDISTLTTADFNSITGWSSGDNLNNVTLYTDSTVGSWSTSGYNTITLNRAAMDDITSNNALYICILNHTYDLRDTEPTTGNEYLNGMYYADNTGTSKDPYISYELHSNSVFFGTNF